MWQCTIIRPTKGATKRIVKPTSPREGGGRREASCAKRGSTRRSYGEIREIRGDVYGEHSAGRPPYSGSVSRLMVHS